jgi:molecular chaperone GrpE
MPKDMPDHESRDDFNAQDEAPKLTSPSHQELLQKLDEADAKANQYWERILRMQAESENVARRAERDLANAHKYALDKFVAELIPIVDSLELCVNSVTKKDLEGPVKAIIDGVNLTLKMFYTAMDKFGVKQVNPIAEAFDPEFQQAISMQYEPNVKPGTVISVLQKGYTLNSRLVRPALVVVSKNEQ